LRPGLGAYCTVIPEAHAVGYPVSMPTINEVWVPDKTFGLSGMTELFSCDLLPLNCHCV